MRVSPNRSTAATYEGYACYADLRLDRQWLTNLDTKSGSGNMYFGLLNSQCSYLSRQLAVWHNLLYLFDLLGGGLPFRSIFGYLVYSHEGMTIFFSILQDAVFMGTSAAFGIYSSMLTRAINGDPTLRTQKCVGCDNPVGRHCFGSILRYLAYLPR